MARRLSRRHFLQAVAGAGIALAAAACERDSGGEVPTVDPEADETPIVTNVPGYGDEQRWADRTLVIATPGDEGSDYLTAQVEAIFEPFQRLTGATIRTTRTDIELLQQQVDSGDVEWSICDVPAEMVLPLANRGTIAEIDYSVVNDGDLHPALVLTHGVGVSLYATLLAYHKESLEPDQQEPQSWADFWSTSRFPGFRGLQEAPIGTLEFAALAGGASIKNLYPLDVDAAFAQLDLIVDDVLLWWRQGAQPTQMIAAGELAMVATWHDRILTLIEGGAPVGFTWHQSQINGNCWVVPNGAPETEVAMDFINFATRAEVCAAFSRLFPFGPINMRAYDLLGEEARDSLPGAPGLADRQFAIDLEWWFLNGDTVGERFQTWLSEGEPQDEN